jgi:hypothetical protein
MSSGESVEASIAAMVSRTFVAFIAHQMRWEVFFFLLKVVRDFCQFRNDRFGVGAVARRIFMSSGVRISLAQGF